MKQYETPEMFRYSFNVLHSDADQNLTNDKSIIVRDFIDIYVKWSGNKGAWKFIGMGNLKEK